MTGVYVVLPQAIKGEKGAMNTSTDTVASEVEPTIVEETSETKQLTQQIQFQVAGTYCLHKLMI